MLLNIKNPKGGDKMFWDDEWYEKVIKNYPRTEKEIKKLVADILHSAFLLTVKEGNFNDKKLLDSIKRTDSRWRILATRLDKDGYPLIAPEGFKLYFKVQPNFTEIVKLLNW